MKRFVGGMFAGWVVLGLAVLVLHTAEDKIIPPKTLVDNQKVKVERWVLQPGERSPVHTHSLDHVYVVIHGSKIRETLPDGTTHDDEQETGRAAFSPAHGKTHFFQNMGAGGYEMIAIELKQ